MEQSLINIETSDFSYYTICLVDNGLFPHPGSSVQIHSAIVDDYIQSLVQKYGIQSIQSIHHSVYYRHSSDRKLANLPPYNLHRMRRFSDIIQHADDFDLTVFDYTVLTVSDLRETNNKKFEVVFDLQEVFNFASIIPLEERFLAVSEDQVLTVDIWLAANNPEVHKQENGDKSMHGKMTFTKVDGKPHQYKIYLGENVVTWDLLFKADDLPDKNALLSLYQTGFFNLDLLAIQTDVVTWDLLFKADDLPDKNALLSLYQTGFFNLDLLAIKSDVVAYLSDNTSKHLGLTEYLQDLISENFDGYQHPLGDFSIELYNNLQLVLHSFIGENLTIANLNKIKAGIAAKMFNTMLDYDLVAKKLK
jgi:hypothetical protein